MWRVYSALLAAVILLIYLTLLSWQTNTGVLPSTLSPISTPGGAEAVRTLGETDFKAVLASLPAESYVLMEVFASWCPACQHFQPAYERVGVFMHMAPGHNVQVSARGVAHLLLTCLEVLCIVPLLCVSLQRNGAPSLAFVRPIQCTSDWFSSPEIIETMR